MNLLKRIFRKIHFILFNLFTVIKIAVLSICHKNKVYIFGAPVHGNIGDHAIIYAEKKFLNDNFPEDKVIEIESNVFMRFTKIIKFFVGKSNIFITGGGFLGSLWLNEEEMFRTTLNEFPNNKIIVFPQTIYFSDDKEGNEVMMESTKIYSGHKNLVFCCRETYSYELLQEKFKCKTILVPDMVLYLDQIDLKQERKNVLMCMRNDKEKKDNNYSELIAYIKKTLNRDVDSTDTVIKKNIYSFNREKTFFNKLRQFSNYELVITDRLHGMIFAFLTQTPCLVFNNKSYKVKGVYKWIEKCNYVKFFDNDYDKIDTFIKEFQPFENNIKEKYKALIDVINDRYNWK